MGNHNRRKRKNHFFCVDCGVNVSDKKEHYFVHTSLWVGVANLSIDQMCCISCLEKRIKRQLNRNDFTDAYINNPKRNVMSSDLLAALRR